MSYCFIFVPVFVERAFFCGMLRKSDDFIFIKIQVTDCLTCFLVNIRVLTCLTTCHDQSSVYSSLSPRRGIENRAVGVESLLPEFTDKNLPHIHFLINNSILKIFPYQCITPYKTKNCPQKRQFLSLLID